MSVLPPLPEPAHYFPLRGRFTVAPGLLPLRTDLGNGTQDARLFQFDTEFPEFRANKLACLAEPPGKYTLTDPRFAEVAPEICRFIAGQIATEWPDYFSGDGTTLHCALTGDTIPLNQLDTFDALCRQFPEDLAVIRVPETGRDYNAALHICAPSHWVPAEKIGASFLTTHEPVPHFTRIAQASPGLTKVILERPPFVRFNWGIEFTDRLNLHPAPPPDADATTWNRRILHPDDSPPLWLRLERQVLWGLPHLQAYLFAIRIYRISGEAIRRDPAQCAALLETLDTMPPESREYKSLAGETHHAVREWLVCGS